MSEHPPPRGVIGRDGPPSTHAPKTAALVAYIEDRLSAAGAARVEAHLEACPRCRRHLEAMRTYERLRSEASAMSIEVDFDRIDLAIRREAKAGARRIRVRRTGVALSAAAAAVAGIALAHQGWLPSRSEQAPRAGRAPDHAPAPRASVEPRAELEGIVTALVGNAFVEEHGEQRPLKLSTSLREGMRLRLAASARLHVRLASRTGFALHGPASLQLARLRRGDVLLVLAEGRIINEVEPRHGTGHPAIPPAPPPDRPTRPIRPLRSGETSDHPLDYAVQSGAYRMRVRGTRFQVDTHGTTVGLLLTRGHVDVDHAATGQTLERLSAPARWSASRHPHHRRTSSPGRPPQHAVEGGQARSDELQPPYGLGLPPLATTSLRLPDLPHVERWSVGETDIGGAGRLGMRVPAGHVSVVAHLRGGRELRHVLPVTTEHAEVPMATLRPLLARLRRGPHAGTLAPEAIAPVVRDALPRLQGCYERSLKRRPDLEGRLHLRITVARSGRVQQLKLKSHQELPQRLATCLRAQARSWRFPEPEGGPATFDLPLSLSPRK